MKRTCFILLLYLFSSGHNVYSRQWIPIDGATQGKTVTMTILESNQFKHKVKVTIHGMRDDQIDYNGTSYHYLSLDGVGRLTKVGAPSLPVISQLIAIPPGSTMSASIDEVKWTDIEMGTIYPVQDQEITSESFNILRINENDYSNAFLPSIVTTGKEMSWRGIMNKGVTMCPFKYYPQENRLSVLNEFILQIDFHQKNNAKKIEIKRESENMGLFDNTVYIEMDRGRHRFINTYHYDYLIIVGIGISENSVFNAKLNDFKMWKALKGYKTKVAYVSDLIQQGISVKNYIKQEYLNYGISNVLFIGDNQNINMDSYLSTGGTGYIYGDYIYGCIDNDDMADIAIGRFSISDVNDFKHMVDKTIKYESSYSSSNTTLLVAHGEGALHPDSYQSCSDTIMGASYQEPTTFVTAYGAPGNNATNQDVIDQINLGAHIVNYRGHAGESFWGSPNWNYAGESFTSSEIENMDSTTCAVFFNVACYNGNIGSSQACMLETFTRSDQGAVAFIGATDSTNTYPNNKYDILLFQKLLNQRIYHLGDLNVKAHNYNISTYGLNSGDNYKAVDNAYAYICGGDPTLELWTAEPQSIGNVDLSSDNNGNITLYTGLSGDYYISLVSDNAELIDNIHVSGSPCTFAKPTGNFFIAVNKHNYFPYIIYYDTESDYIQDVVFFYDAYYNNTPLEIGNDVTYDENYGDVIVKSGKKLIIKKGTGGVVFVNGFKCEKGAKLEVK